jgi:hypothetical protein
MMDRVNKMLSDAVTLRNKVACEKAEGRSECVRVRTGDDLWWLVCVLGELRQDGILAEEEIVSLVESLA